MTHYTIYDQNTAIAPADTIFTGLEQMIGFVPNVFAVMGGTPNVLLAFTEMNQQFMQSGFNPIEREVIQLAVSVQNSCTYCVAGHTAFAHQAKMQASEISALREGRRMADPKLEALRKFAETLANQKGKNCDNALKTFLDAGFGTEQIQDVVLGVSVKIVSNTIGNLFDIPLDPAFASYRWEHPGEASNVIAA